MFVSFLAQWAIFLKIPSIVEMEIFDGLVLDRSDKIKFFFNSQIDQELTHWPTR